MFLHCINFKFFFIFRLYSTPAAKSQGDVLAWLRKDVNSLDPAARRALANKLEMLIAKSESSFIKIYLFS